jgi:AcrR family transcriptional regulator
MPASRRRHQPTSPRLTLVQMLDEATAIVETDGLDGLTMRKLATRCGVSPMALYGYVRTREELVAALIDRYLAEIPLPDVEHLVWQEQVAAVFRAVNRAFEAHPVLSEIIGRQSMDSIAFYRGAEIALRALRRAGLSERSSVGALDALTSFVTGFAQRKAERRLRSTQSAARLGAIRKLPPGEFRTVIELAGQLVSWDSERHFEDGLGMVIGGIEHRLAAESGQRASGEDQ